MNFLDAMKCMVYEETRREEGMISTSDGYCIYAYPSEDNSITLRMEVEDAYDYNEFTIKLSKESELKDLIKMLINLL